MCKYLPRPGEGPYSDLSMVGQLVNFVSTFQSLSFPSPLPLTLGNIGVTGGIFGIWLRHNSVGNTLSVWLNVLMRFPFISMYSSLSANCPGTAMSSWNTPAHHANSPGILTQKDIWQFKKIFWNDLIKHEILDLM